MTTGSEFSSVFNVIYEGDEFEENTISVQGLRKFGSSGGVWECDVE